MRIYLVTLLLVLLTSCAVTPPVSEPQVDDSARLFAEGRFQQAAEQFSQLALEASATERQRLQLRAAAAYARADQLSQAKQLYQEIRPDTTDWQIAILDRLTQAHIAMAERQAAQVLALLREPLPANAEQALQAEYHDLRADAYTLLGNRIETARELVLREYYLVDPEMIWGNQRDIWQALATLSERALEQLRTAPPPDHLSGWMHLVQIAKAYQLQPQILKQEIAKWRQLYADHPVLDQILVGLLGRKEEDVAYPGQIALLLPLSGKFSLPAKAIRDGFLAAYYLHPQQTDQQIRIYDVGATPDHIHQVYQQALNDGAQMIVGPLNKESALRLAELESIPVPTLTLNYLPEESVSTPVNLYQFGLSPEEEALQVAERTWLDGHVNAVALIPSGPWGERVFATFKQRWEHMGGMVVEMQTYDATRNDFSQPIKQLLDIDESQRRRRQVANTIEHELKFTPRRRQDVDFIFVAAFPRQARAIRPQLKFFHAADLPVYATSHAFTGVLNPERDRDMDGLVFGDMPWVLTETTSHRGLRTRLEGQISPAGTNLQRLYALGIDAYNIIGALNTLRNYPYERFDGETGSLSLDEKRRVRRQLTWVRFRSGQPVALESEL